MTAIEIQTHGHSVALIFNAMKFSYCSLFAALSATTSAYVKVHDPSDYVDVSADASDNAIKANYTLNPTFYQLGDIIGTYQFNHENHKISHLTLSVHANDTSVVVAANGYNPLRPAVTA